MFQILIVAGGQFNRGEQRKAILKEDHEDMDCIRR